MKNVLKLIWQNKSQILEGIKNSIIRDETVEEISRLRYDICDECEHKGKKCAVKGTSPCCNECGCSLAFKTRSLSASCPLDKWDSLITEDEEETLNKL